jgi:TonB-dependent starch-binding outer membrane protein SusC
MMDHYFKWFNRTERKASGKNSFIKALFFVATFLISSGLYAQERSISGKITDAGDGSGVPGASIAIKGTTKGVVTDANGGFKLSVPAGSSIIISSVGYASQTIAVGAKTEFNVALAVDAKTIDEIVVVGYGEQKKRDVTGSVSALKSADFNPGVSPSVDQLMQGRAAGVQITQNNGSPGAKTSVRIRGGTSITAGNDPLYVIDGVPLDNSITSPASTARANGIDSGIPANEDSNPLNFLNPSDIASIDILKDASATAIYGARAANGVILVTTKRGSKGQGRVSYDSYYGMSSLRKKLPILTGDEWRAVSKANGGVAGGTANLDLQDEVFQSGVIQNHVVGVAGGTESTNYYVSVGYAGQEGIIKGGNMERMSARVNLQQRAMKNKLLIDFGLTGSREKQKQVPAAGASGDYRGGVLAGLFKWNPTNPLKNADGTYNQISQSVPNPLAIKDLVNDRGQVDRLLANISAEYQIIDGLKAKVFASASSSNGGRNAYYSKNLINYTPYGGVATIGNVLGTSYQIDYTLNYNTKIGSNQNLNLLGGFSYQNFYNSGSGSTVRNFLNDALGSNNLSAGSDFTVPSYSYKTKREIQSFFGRANYDIAGKYILTATLRRDGASVFGDNNKYGIFPSVSVGWRISDESFMKNQSLFSNLRLRAGWGTVGNANISPYSSLTTVVADPGKSAILGNSFKPGTGLSRAANPDLKWESTSSTNIGLDYAMFNNKIQGSIELFNKDTKNLLYTIPIPQPAPAPNQLANVGSLNNKGIEFELSSTNVSTSKFSWKTTFNFTTLKNEVTSIQEGANFLIFAKGVGAGASNAPIQILKPGFPVGTYVLTPISGYGPEVAGAPSPKYGAKDAIDLVATGESLTFGSGLPTWYGGLSNSFTFGGFDASLFLQYSGGNKILNNTFYEYTRLDNITKNAYGAVKPLYNDPATKFNSDFLENGNYLRISNLTLGYNLNTGAKKVFQTARVYVSGQNLGVLTKYKGFDPGINTPLAGDNGTSGLSIDYLAYPLPRNVTFGVSLGF